MKKIGTAKTKEKSFTEKLVVAGLAFLSVAAFAALAVPGIVFAKHNDINSNVFTLEPLARPLLLCSGSGSDKLPPCENLCDLVAEIANIIYFLIALVIWIIAPALVAAGGIMYMIAGPNPGMVETAKKTITGAVWGLAIVLCAWIIVYTFILALGGTSQFFVTKVGGFPGGQGACSI